MKKNLLIATALIISVFTAGIAYAGTLEPGVAKLERTTSPFYKIVVNANVDVVLVQESSARKAWIEGDEALIGDLGVAVKNGVLTVTARKPFMSYRGKVQVTIAVQEIELLEINANAGIATIEPLNSPKLAVKLNGFCDVHLKSTGKIVMEAEDGYSIRYENKSANKSNVVVINGTED
jgi:hypothetical protein